MGLRVQVGLEKRPALDAAQRQGSPSGQPGPHLIRLQRLCFDQQAAPLAQEHKAPDNPDEDGQEVERARWDG
jgi:hypothetical protein